MASLILATIESAQHRAMSQQQQHEQELSQQTGAAAAQRPHTQDISILDEEGEGEEEGRMETAVPAASAGDFSQPVTGFRRHAPRSARADSAFLRYAAAGEEEGDEDQQPLAGKTVPTERYAQPRAQAQAEVVGSRYGGDGGDSGGSGDREKMTEAVRDGRAPVNPMRRKRFLDEASDDD